MNFECIFSELSLKITTRNNPEFKKSLTQRVKPSKSENISNYYACVHIVMHAHYKRLTFTYKINVMPVKTRSKSRSATKIIMAKSMYMQLTISDVIRLQHATIYIKFVLTAAKEMHSCQKCSGIWRDGVSNPDDWVGCDGCWRWFHCRCIGLKPPVDESVPIQCQICKN